MSPNIVDVPWVVKLTLVMKHRYAESAMLLLELNCLADYCRKANNVPETRVGRKESGLFKDQESLEDRGATASKFHLGELRGAKNFYKEGKEVWQEGYMLAELGL